MPAWYEGMQCNKCKINLMAGDFVFAVGERQYLCLKCAKELYAQVKYIVESDKQE